MDSFFEAAQAFLWRCWTTLGVAGVSRPFVDLLVDPEGLLVLTGIALDDARLSAEVVDWSARCFGYVSVSRLKNIMRSLTPAERARVYELTAQVNAAAPARWPTGEVEATDVVRLSGKSRLPSLASPALAHLRYRALFGTTSRAEILLCLQRQRGARTAAEIAQITAYAKRIVARTLEELTQGGIVVATQNGNRLNYDGAFDWIFWARVIGACEATRAAKASVRRIELIRVLNELGQDESQILGDRQLADAFIKAAQHP
ncbi:MAG: hypothetical protein IPK13_09265 [Deltaproteobacteria bacterium]|nr:hypothetical protein [Deltaproteobacteria bacterium]